MSTEILIKEKSKNLSDSKLHPSASEKNFSYTKITNLDLNKIQNYKLNKKISKTCINTLQEKLRKKEVKEKFENRILYGLFISVVAVLFYVST